MIITGVAAELFQRRGTFESVNEKGAVVLWWSLVGSSEPAVLDLLTSNVQLK